MGRARNLRLPCAPLHESLPAVTTSIWFWIAFHIGVFIAIGIDLFTFHQRGRELSMTAAARRSVLWVLVSLGFNAVVWRIKGPHHGLDFFTGYLIEYSLSMDNIFVFVLIFAHFRVPPRAQHRVLVWGIIGALIMRGAMILCGIALVQRFHFVLYLFGLSCSSRRHVCFLKNIQRAISPKVGCCGCAVGSCRLRGNSMAYSLKCAWMAVGC